MAESIMDDAIDVGQLGEEAVGVGIGGACGPRPGRAGWPVKAVADVATRGWRLAQLYFAQSGMILPGRATQGRPCATFTPPPGARMLRLPTASGADVAALFGAALSPDGSPRPDAPSRPTTLFFYGNGMCLANSVAIFEHMRRIGANVLAPDYLGYGLSGGRAGEQACYATADATWRHLRARGDIDPDLIVPSGVSLGGAVAVDLASRQPAVAGLVALVTFTSIPAVARHLHPDVPIWRLVRMKFDSLSKIRSVKCPTLIGHSTADALTPPRMADELAAAAGGPVSRLVIEGANHHAAEMLEVGGDVIFGTVGRFLDAL